MKNLLYPFLKLFWGLDENNSREFDQPKKILIVRQHNQLGDLLACISVFRALKEKFPSAEVSVIVSPANKNALHKSKFIEELFVFDKSKILSFVYFNKLMRFLRKDYDLAVVPVTVSLSLTSNLLCRAAKAKVRIGPNSLNGKENSSAFLFDRRIDLNWKKYPDANVADFSLDILRPFGISTYNFNSEISFDEKDKAGSQKFIHSFTRKMGKIIGLHVGAGKPPNRWSFENFISLINLLEKTYQPIIYLTGSTADLEIIKLISSAISSETKVFLNKDISEVAALIAQSSLFITNDTGIMHVAGTTPTPQISIFGPTNPFNWAPVGNQKYFLRHSDLINDVTVEEVFSLCRTLLSNEKDLS
ncbi:MAG: ADP-heptose--LPS heptosyltransferase [Ignavibacteria bacterium CG22_combo_CG10-13_8_21_14_all_37_15]|nr:MAG: ADP-heptose--LPS heptosyltransferase [Ignavibacteria bacterium CG22_combo_CG10-13_8_21_14_all_37_15]